MKRLIDLLITAVKEAAVYNPDVQICPHCILWTDGDRQWEPVIERLQAAIPELFVLGEYDSSRRTGPAIWLRCVMARKIEQFNIDEHQPIIIYLPGVSRQDLRAVESCPNHLKPLAELQYRGVIWSQLANNKDWSILAFLRSNQGGLSLDVAQDNETKGALQLALYRLLDEDIDLLRDRHLDRDYFNTLLTGGDPVRDLLQWLDQGDSIKTQIGPNEWQAFISVSNSLFGFNPQTHGTLAGAEKLARREGPWLPIWERFSEAPHRYPNIPGLIRKCKPPDDKLFWQMSSDGKFAGWPQWNEEQEALLRTELLSFAKLAPHDAKSQILELETRHSGRRKTVWAELGESPLALALRHLAVLANNSANTLSAGTCEDLSIGYQTSGWKVDDAVIRALGCTDSPENIAAVFAAIRAIYLPWSENSARHLQKIVEKDGYPGGSVNSLRKPKKVEDECVIFVDGLRFDIAKRLAQKLSEVQCTVNERAVWSALPSVTATGKPAVSPVYHKLEGLEANADFEPVVAQTGQSLKGGYHLKKLLVDEGWTILDRSSYGTGKGNAWCEFGDIDHEGHDRGWKLAKHLDSLIKEICEQVKGLLVIGRWKTVRIVTDHGWLLMPGNLPKIDLPIALSENKWGRCASIKPGAKTQERLFPWFWNANQQFALADGISCFRKGNDYAHGGLSLQECLNLELTVSLSKEANATALEITDIRWKGLRCTVVVDGEHADCLVDVRSQAGDASTSLVVNPKLLRDDGSASVVVEDEDLDGMHAFVVIIRSGGELITQSETKIGSLNNKSENAND